jgi:hypothetical protein
MRKLMAALAVEISVVAGSLKKKQKPEGELTVTLHINKITNSFE